MTKADYNVGVPKEHLHFSLQEIFFDRLTDKMGYSHDGGNFRLDTGKAKMDHDDG